MVLYPAYKYGDVLGLDSGVFMELLNNGIELENDRFLRMVIASSIPYMKKEDGVKIIQDITGAGREYLGRGFDEGTFNKLKKQLNG